MLKNFLKVAGRNIFRQKTYSLLNVLGLSLGIACILMLSLHVKEELSYDKNFPKHDRIYRVGSTEWSKSSPPLAGEMIKYFPEINSFARFAGGSTNVFHTVEGKKEKLTGYFADSSVLKVFDLKALLGNPFDALSAPGSIVITRSTALRLFGKTNPIGQKLIQDDKYDVYVKGVIEDLPAN